MYVYQDTALLPPNFVNSDFTASVKLGDSKESFEIRERRRKLRNEPGLVAVPALILTELQMGLLGNCS